MDALLFKKDEKKAVGKMQKKIDKKFNEVGGEIKMGDKVKMKRNHQVGMVMELKRQKSSGKNWFLAHAGGNSRFSGC